MCSRAGTDCCSQPTKSFVHVIDSMFNQHAKWLEKGEAANSTGARRCLQMNSADHLAGMASRSQWLHPPGPGFPRCRHKQESRSRAHLPAARRELPAERDADHCLRSRDYINVIVADKQPHLQYLDHGRCAQRIAPRGVGIWDWASHGPDCSGTGCSDGLCRRYSPPWNRVAAVEILKETVSPT